VDEVRVAVGLQLPVMALGAQAICEQDARLRCVGGAGDAASLLEGCRRWRADVAVTEPGLLKPDGTLAIQALRQLGVKVLLIGDATLIDEIAALLRAGAAGFVAAGADRHELATALTQVAAGRLVFEAELTRHLLCAHQAAQAPPRLTDREHQVLTLVADGHSNRQIAETLYVCQSTVKTHLESVHDKLGTRRRAAAVAEALRLGLLGDRNAPAAS
jgi:DNA-binding NarL/FixJ family response regulator